MCKSMKLLFFFFIPEYLFGARGACGELGIVSLLLLPSALVLNLWSVVKIPALEGESEIGECYVIAYEFLCHLCKESEKLSRFVN